MKTLGPRSVSSFLKIVVVIAFVLTALFLIFLAVVALWSALSMANPGIGVPRWRWWLPDGPRIFVSNPRGAAGLVLLALYTLGLLGILGRLRKIFVTLVEGKPFQAENARRLRIIGLILAGLEASRFAIWGLLVWSLPPDQLHMIRPPVDWVGLFGIGVLFVLAEVFEEGVRMRKDLDLTI